MTNILVYDSIPSPLGELFLAATQAGLCRVAWCMAEDAFVAEVEAACKGPARKGSVDGVVAEAGRQLGEYFRGERQVFELPLDFSGLRPFQERVLRELGRVPWGEVVTYGELAHRCGQPRAARAVGGAMRANPLPVIVPCHRVLLSTGALGGFGGRPHLKQQLLEMEGWTLRDGAVLDAPLSMPPLLSRVS
jgi:methylated-DNA-[protein]-cysteine S-methyltransferase